MGPFDLSKLDNPEQAEDTPLFGGNVLFKAAAEGESEKIWSFAGIASDETPDSDGDTILRKSIDLSYAQRRGYVNWDHSRQPEDQIGRLTKAVIIAPGESEQLSEQFGVDIPRTASVYVEGQLYKNSKKAQSVQEIMSSAQPGETGLGLSVDGVCARLKKSGGIVKAIVRGVAMTSIPAHTGTLVSLRKSLNQMSQMLGVDEVASPDAAAIAAEVVRMLEAKHGDLSHLSKSAEQMLDRDEAVLFVLRQHPNLSMTLATQIVDYTVQQKEGKQ